MAAAASSTEEGSSIDVQRTVEERLDALISELEGHIFNVKVSKEEVLGVILAKYCRWEGPKILTIAIQALEDANFHTEAAEVQEIANKSQLLFLLCDAPPPPQPSTSSTSEAAADSSQQQKVIGVGGGREVGGEGGYDSEGWRNEGEVPSMSGNKTTTYFVDSHISGRWRCTCPDHKIRRQYNGTDCKHIRVVKEAQKDV